MLAEAAAFKVSFGGRTNPWKLTELLRVRRGRPGDRRAAEQRDELASPNSITSSARTRNDSGIVSPIAFAVLLLTISSNLVACSTGRSAGLAPFRILSM
jgi:hypothetical protein